MLLSSNTSIVSCKVKRRSVVRLTRTLSTKVPIRSVACVTNAIMGAGSLSDVCSTRVLPSFRSLGTSGVGCTHDFCARCLGASTFGKGHLMRPCSRRLCMMRGPPTAPLARVRVSSICSLPCREACRPSCRTGNKIPTVGRVGFDLVDGEKYFKKYDFYTLAFRRKEVIRIEDRRSLVRRTGRVAGSGSFGKCVRSINNPATGFQRPSYGGRVRRNIYGAHRYLFPSPYGGLSTSRESCIDLLEGLESVPGIGGIFVHSKVHFSCLLTSGGRRFLERLYRCRIDKRLGMTPRRITNPILSLVKGPRRGICRRFAERFCGVGREVKGRRCLIPCLVSSRPNSALGRTMRLTRCYHSLNCVPRRIRSFCPAPSALSAYVCCAKMSPEAVRGICIPGDPRRGTVRETLVRCHGPRLCSLIVRTLRGTKESSLVKFKPGYLMEPERVHNFKGSGGTNEGRPGGKLENSGNRGERGGSRRENEIRKGGGGGSVEGIRSGGGEG